jgi:hypothetical protein
MQTQGREMTEKTQSPYATNTSPLRVEIVALIGKKKLHTTDIAKNFEGYSRERMANILRGMMESKILSRQTGDDGRVLWMKYKAPPKPPKKAKPFLNGTTKQRLSLSYMASPYRAGAQDAYQIGSHQ